MTGSIRHRLLVWMMGAVALLLALFGSVVYTAISHAMQQGFDASLLTAANTLAASVQAEDSEIEVELDTDMIDQLQQGQGLFCFQFWLDDGTALARSASLGHTDLPKFAGEAGKPSFRSLALPGDKSGRAVGISFLPALEEEYEYENDDDDDNRDSDNDAIKHLPRELSRIVLVAAGDTTAVQARMRGLLWLLLAAWAVTMAAAWWVSSVIVGRGLKPLNAVAGQIAAVSEDDLAARVDADGTPTELGPVVDKLNDLLHRLEAAFQRQRGFTADVAHELRTPLAGIRTTIEVALTSTRSDAEYNEALTDCLEIEQRMAATVENLLTLARLDAGQITFRQETIHLATMVDNCWKPVAQKAQARGLAFENQIPPETTCSCDKDSLATVLTNLLDNAVEYADDNGRVLAKTDSGGDAPRITIANTGCTLSSDQIAHIFDEFWRGDSSRRDTGVHCGLGLALVSRIVTAMGGDAVARIDANGLFTVSVTLTG